MPTGEKCEVCLGAKRASYHTYNILSMNLVYVIIFYRDLFATIQISNVLALLLPNHIQRKGSKIQVLGKAIV